MLMGDVTDRVSLLLLVVLVVVVEEEEEEVFSPVGLEGTTHSLERLEYGLVASWEVGGEEVVFFFGLGGGEWLTFRSTFLFFFGLVYILGGLSVAGHVGPVFISQAMARVCSDEAFISSLDDPATHNCVVVVAAAAAGAGAA